MRRLITKTHLSLVVVALSACADSTETAPIEIGGTVELAELTTTRIAGTFTFHDDTLVFDARELAPNLLVTTLKVHGMTIDSTLDTRDGNRMWSQDAFATETGADTTISEDDVMVIFAFVKVIEEQYPDAISRGDGLAFHFGSVINYWSQWIPAMEVTRIKLEDRERAQDMCWWAQDTNGQWPTGGWPGPSGGTERWMSYDGHDCSSCNGDPVQGQGKTNCSSVAAYGNWDSPNTTWWWYGGAWHTSASGHGNGSYITGQCFGRYGGGCGSGKAYFRENASHDHCVRNGHVDFSSWCSDELSRVTSPYNCY